MFSWCQITQEIRTGACRYSASYSPGYMIVPRRDIGYKRPEHIERSAMAILFLLFYVLFDLVERPMARPFDHDLHVLFPGAYSQLAKDLELFHLPWVRSVQDRPRTKAVAQAQRHIITVRDINYFIKDFVKWIFFFIAQHPAGDHGPASRHDTHDAFLPGKSRQAAARHAGMDREKIHSLARLILQYRQNVARGKIQYIFAARKRPRGDLVYGHCADRHA